MSPQCFRVLSERYLASEIDFVRWNPKYDLLAIATKRADVILQRLFWKKAWQVSSQVSADSSSSNAIRINDLCWSPTGKHLAIVYSTRKIIFVEVETGRVVHEIGGGLNFEQRDNDQIMMMSKWVELHAEEKTENGESSMNPFVFEDDDDLLVPLPPMEKTRPAPGSVVDFEQTGLTDEQGNGKLSLFILGDQPWRLRLYLNGFIHMADLDMGKFVESEMFSIAADISGNFERLGVAFLTNQKDLNFGLFRTPLSSFSFDYWRRISKRVSRVYSALRYVETMAQKVSDTWDNSISSLDSKITKYAVSKANSDETVGDDFINTLTFGTASPEFEHFVTHSLTEKGMKKLTNSISNAFHNLFTILGVNLDCGVASLYHHLTALCDLVPSGRDDDSDWSECIRTVSKLALKVSSVYDVAQTESNSVGLFTRWLHRCVVAISDENLTPTLSHFSHDEIDAVADYIEQKFCKTVTEDIGIDSGTAPAQFGLDKVGILLKDDNSGMVPNMDLFDDLPVFDCIKLVRYQILSGFHRLSVIFSQRFALMATTSCPVIPSGDELHRRIFMIHDSDRERFRLIYPCQSSNSQLCLMEFDDQSGAMVSSWKVISEIGMVRDLVSVDLYGASVVMALLRERKEKEASDWNYVLYQIDVTELGNCAVENAGDDGSQQELVSVPWNTIKNQPLSDGQYCLISVSGSRKVGCALFVCQTRLKLLEMEPEDDTVTGEEDNAAMDFDQA